jgi:hypothetical protein
VGVRARAKKSHFLHFSVFVACSKAIGAAPPPKNIGQVIYEYIDHKNGTIFLTNNLLIANSLDQQPNSKNTVDKLNESKLSGLVNFFCWFCHWYAGGAAAVASFSSN